MGIECAEDRPSNRDTARRVAHHRKKEQTHRTPTGERVSRSEQQHGEGQRSHRVDDDPIHRKTAYAQRRIAVVAVDAAGQNRQFDGDVDHHQHTHTAPQLATSHAVAQNLQHQIRHPAEENDVNAQAPQRNTGEGIQHGPLTDARMPHQSQHIVDRFVEVRYRSPDEKQRQRHRSRSGDLPHRVHGEAGHQHGHGHGRHELSYLRHLGAIGSHRQIEMPTDPTHACSSS
jgi:hypothetical protein